MDIILQSLLSAMQQLQATANGTLSGGFTSVNNMYAADDPTGSHNKDSCTNYTDCSHTTNDTGCDNRGTCPPQNVAITAINGYNTSAAANGMVTVHNNGCWPPDTNGASCKNTVQCGPPTAVSAAWRNNIG